MKFGWRRVLGGVGIAVLALAGSASAQTDLTGTWAMESQVLLQEEQPCLYQGQAQITHSGSSITGTADLSLISGPQSCPAEMSADLSGTVEEGGGQIFVDGTLSGQLGAADFSGTLSPNPGGGGTFDVSQGPFQGSSGTWSAQLLQAIIEIPGLTPIGLTILVLLLLAAGAWYLRRRPASVPKP